jgi:hypothetical protein
MDRITDEEVENLARRRVVAWQIEEAMKSGRHLSNLAR